MKKIFVILLIGVMLISMQSSILGAGSSNDSGPTNSNDEKDKQPKDETIYEDGKSSTGIGDKKAEDINGTIYETIDYTAALTLDISGTRKSFEVRLPMDQLLHDVSEDEERIDALLVVDWQTHVVDKIRNDYGIPENSDTEDSKALKAFSQDANKFVCLRLDANMNVKTAGTVVKTYEKYLKGNKQEEVTKRSRNSSEVTGILNYMKNKDINEGIREAWVAKWEKEGLWNAVTDYDWDAETKHNLAVRHNITIYPETNLKLVEVSAPATPVVPLSSFNVVCTIENDSEQDAPDVPVMVATETGSFFAYAGEIPGKSVKTVSVSVKAPANTAMEDISCTMTAVVNPGFTVPETRHDDNSKNFTVKVKGTHTDPRGVTINEEGHIQWHDVLTYRVQWDTYHPETRCDGSGPNHGHSTVWVYDGKSYATKEYEVYNDIWVAHRWIDASGSDTDVDRNTAYDLNFMLKAPWVTDNKSLYAFGHRYDHTLRAGYGFRFAAPLSAKMTSSFFGHAGSDIHTGVRNTMYTDWSASGFKKSPAGDRLDLMAFSSTGNAGVEITGYVLNTHTYGPHVCPEEVVSNTRIYKFLNSTYAKYDFKINPQSKDSERKVYTGVKEADGIYTCKITTHFDTHVVSARRTAPAPGYRTSEFTIGIYEDMYYDLYNQEEKN